MSEARQLQAKWDALYERMPRGLPQPAEVLEHNAHLLPASGEALDLACGLGGSALFLALRGLRVKAYDLSAVAIERLRSCAGALPVEAAVRDVESAGLPEDAFDVVVVSRFLARPLCPAIARSIKPKGLLFYQTYIAGKQSVKGPSNPDFLLQPNELLALFPDFRLLFYREDGRVGNLAEGHRDEAYFVGQKSE
jgi:SAM-dependent methyltransferase